VDTGCDGGFDIGISTGIARFQAHGLCSRQADAVGDRGMGAAVWGGIGACGGAGDLAAANAHPNGVADAVPPWRWRDR